MAESEAHRTLVKKVAEEIGKRHPRCRIVCDLQLFPSDELPPVIDGFRPDVYARDRATGLIVIAEAKTDDDIDREHTHAQARSFINYLERREQGRFILSVMGTGADRAKTLLRFMSKEAGCRTTAIEVFDGNDFWLFDLRNGVTWHLN